MNRKLNSSILGHFKKSWKCYHVKKHLPHAFWGPHDTPRIKLWPFLKVGFKLCLGQISIFDQEEMTRNMVIRKMSENQSVVISTKTGRSFQSKWTILSRTGRSFKSKRTNIQIKVDDNSPQCGRSLVRFDDHSHQSGRSWLKLNDHSHQAGRSWVRLDDHSHLSQRSITLNYTILNQTDWSFIWKWTTLSPTGRSYT